jgi:hypothetical protein
MAGIARLIVRALVAALVVAASANSAPRAFLDAYCVGCHNQKLRTGGIALDAPDLASAETIERVIVRLRAGSMPPPGSKRPDTAAYRDAAVALESQIDRAATPLPRTTNTVHRLNRAEYGNAIRDLFALEIDVASLLPGDETADGSFDNFAGVLSISTAHIERYLSVARLVTRLAAGLPPSSPKVEKFEIPLHMLQNQRQSEDLPLGSRGGAAVRYNFPVDGEYRIKVRLQRQYQDYLKGMGWPQQLDVRLDGALLKRFTVGGGAKGRPAAASYAGDGEPGYAGDPEWEHYMQVGGDAHLELRARVEAGPRIVGVSFVRQMWEPEGLPQPLQRGRVIADDQVYMDYANVGSVLIAGPYESAGMAKDTPGRRAVFVCQPNALEEERGCAEKILARIARLAYRRPLARKDLDTLLGFFDAGRREGGTFDHGIQQALERMLVDPDFLLRVQRGGDSAALELASRLSFFLWSSIPDDRLLGLAERRQLTNPAVLESEARRMLADPRSTRALIENFAAQWLNLRRVEETVVDPIRYPNYDRSLLLAFKMETELFLASILREDRPVSDLLKAGYTFVNERLAAHYGIPGIQGSRFRRVSLPDPEQRGGLLAQGAVLATTSYPDRTSPVLRGKWLWNNIVGLPVPPPPPGLDTTLDSKPGARPASIRERLAEHRRNPSCNSCHSVIDPLGFALENFDVIGGWRTQDESGLPVETTSITLSGKKVTGLAGLRSLILEEPEQFPRTVTEKLMSYALGRRLEYYDKPVVRGIVRDAAASQYRCSSIILGIVKSRAFLGMP